MGRPLLRRRRRAAPQIFDTEKASIAFEQAQAVSVRSGTYMAQRMPPHPSA